MLQKYRKDEILQVPLTVQRIYYCQSSSCFKTRDGIEVPVYYKDKVPFITFRFESGPLELKLAVAIAITTKQTFVFFEYWKLLDVIFIDGDKTNLHPGNLVWKYPKDGIPGRLPGFRTIPGFSRYAINREGVLYSNMINRELSPYVDHYGYLIYGLTPDVGNRSICGRHRLLALAFLDYPANVDSLDVNHIDGIKLHNDLSNLEWASRKRNCDHAYSTGLRTDNVEVMVKNLYSGEVLTFYSIEECARKLKIDGETVRLRINRPQRVYLPGIVLKKATDDMPWLDVSDPTQELLRSRFPLPFTAKNCRTGEIREYNAVSTFSLATGFAEATIKSRLDKSSPLKYLGDYELQYPDFKMRCLSDFAEMRS